MQHSEIQMFVFAGNELQVQQNFQVEAPDVPSAVSSFVDPNLLLQELIYFSTVIPYKMVLGLFLEYTKKEWILRITEEPQHCILRAPSTPWGLVLLLWKSRKHPAQTC